jgi:hypothetical protein
MSEVFGYHCQTCGKFHEGLPFDYGYDAPYYWHTIPEDEREKRARLTSDFCVIEDRDFFVRGRLPIPVIGHEQNLVLGVWVSLSQKNFTRVRELWSSPECANEPAYFGWLSSKLPFYPDTLSLKSMVHDWSVDKRPLITLEPTDHPLAVEQRIGITLSRVQEIAEYVLHK